MLDFKVRRGLYEDLFNKDTGEPRGIIEAGCWYLCTDKAELFLGMSDNTLKLINGSAVPGDNTISVVKAEINSDGELVIYYSDGTYKSIGKVVSENIENGLVTSIVIGDVEYKHNDGIIELPNFATVDYVDEKLEEAVSPEVDLSNYATKDDVKEAIDKIEIPEVDFSDFYTKEEVEDIIGVAVGGIELPDVPTKVSELDNDAGYIAKIPDEFITESELAEKGYLTEHQSLAGYATEAFVTNKIAEAELNDKDIDLSGFATKDDIKNFISEVPSEYITETELDNKGYLTEHLDISHLATKDELPDVSNFITEIPSEYITEQELSEKGYLTEHQNLDEYAKKADLFSKSYNDLTDTPAIPSIEGLATEHYVDEAVANVDVDLTGYATEQYVNDEIIKAKLENKDIDLSDYAKKSEIPDISGFIKEIPAEYITETELANEGFLKEHQSLEGYATEQFVADKISEAQFNNKEVDLSEYAKKSDIPDTSKFITEVPAEYITETELNNKGYITDISGKADIDHIHSEYLTEHIDISGKADKDHTHSEYAVVDHKHDEYLTEHQDISGKADLEHKHTISDITDFIVPEIPSLEGYATEDYVNTEIAKAKLEGQDIDLSDYAKKSDIPDVSNFITEVPSEYITEDELDSKGYITEHQSLEGYATEKFVSDAIDNIDIPDVNLDDYYKKTEADTKIAEAISDIKLPSVPTKVSELENDVGYLTEHQDLSDYAKRDELPSTEGLASEEYVQEQIGLIEVPEVDLSNYYTKAETVDAITDNIKEKADKVVFTSSKIVANTLGGFKVGEDLVGYTVAELFAKLLGLNSGAVEPDEPEIPEEPKTLVEKIIANQIPMYSVTTDGELLSGAFVELDGTEPPTSSGFFTIRGDNGEITKAGYQDLSIVNDEMYYIIALPKELDYNTMVSLEAWDSEEKIWVESDMKMVSDPDTVAGLCEEVGVDISTIDTDLYTVWVYEDICTGSILRYVIKEDK